MLSDWDMDAAFQCAADPYLKLKVDLKPFDQGQLGGKSNFPFYCCMPAKPCLLQPCFSECVLEYFAVSVEERGVVSVFR